MQTVSQSDPIHGGYDNSSPSGGVPSTVTVTLPAGSAPGSILGGYSDLAQATASPGPLGSPSVVTLWPTAQADAAAIAAPTAAATAGSGLLPTLDSGFQNPAGAAPVTVTLSHQSLLSGLQLRPMRQHLLLPPLLPLMLPLPLALLSLAQRAPALAHRLSHRSPC
ncbi:hypothetical protein CGCF245_v000688 [Colletotrichum fructicola]|nr:hypothetical protein CGCF245_v000688 [Colletotrichum fructicola]